MFRRLLAFLCVLLFPVTANTQSFLCGRYSSDFEKRFPYSVAESPVPGVIFVFNEHELLVFVMRTEENGLLMLIAKEFSSRDIAHIGTCRTPTGPEFDVLIITNRAGSI